MINSLYLSILHVNIIRFFRNRNLYGFLFPFILWLWSFRNLCIFARGPVISIYVIFIFLYFFSVIFWGTWVPGNVSGPFMDLETEKKLKDRYYVPFISCLPIDRKRLYAVQVLFYIMISAATCIISFMIQIIFPQAWSHISFIIYMHFLLFTLLIMSGGLSSILDFPFTFRGKKRDFKNPAVIISIVFLFFWALIGIVLLKRKEIGQYLIKIENFFYIIDHPFVLLIPLVAGILMLWLGGIIFKSIDIK